MTITPHRLSSPRDFWDRRPATPEEESACCLFCHQPIPTWTDTLPEGEEHGVWYLRAVFHSDGCAWVATQGFQVELNGDEHAPCLCGEPTTAGYCPEPYCGYAYGDQDEPAYIHPTSPSDGDLLTRDLIRVWEYPQDWTTTLYTTPANFNHDVREYIALQDREERDGGNPGGIIAPNVWRVLPDGTFAPLDVWEGRYHTDGSEV